MSRTLLFTVGTSLFHSATWRVEGPLAEIRGYRRWVEKEDLLESPEKRKLSPGFTEQELLDLLRSTSPDEMAELLPDSLTEPGPALRTPARYCAEMTTLLLLSEIEGADLGPFLERYDRILIAADPVRKGEPLIHKDGYVAAVHLQATLRRLAPSTECRLLKIQHLSAQGVRYLQKGLEGLRDAAADAVREPDAALDCIVTGGYKAYGYMLAPLALGEASRVRLIYNHEKGEEVVCLARNELLLQDATGTVAVGMFDRGI
ncbi:MAG: hypothetical protein KDD47_25845 [Acidobacteria bacterium]|nr:hypothetical protein [Acidobacteriota bacterium]